LKGERPSLSIEITRECPLRCPGCYAYEDGHLGGGGVTLRGLRDRKGQELIDGVLEVVDRLRPLHLSIVGGDPLVRYRELETMVPLLLDRGIHVQIVTSAFRPPAAEWATLPHLNIVVSIDGLQAEHDIRRAPATYDRILKNIAGQKITVHCTVTGQMMKRPGYLRDFLEFWHPRDEIRKIWFSLFTPQQGMEYAERLSPTDRIDVVQELRRLRVAFPKVYAPDQVLDGYLHPPASPGECIFSQTTECVSADLKTAISPCQFGGDPDCAECGCIASAGLASIAKYKIAGLLPVSEIFTLSRRIGKQLDAMGVSAS
jgi:MoaA/NifB/PqqE/SkfB family radical SAM enzyme